MNRDPTFRMQAQDLGSVSYFPDDHLTHSPDTRGDTSADIEFWEDKPAALPAEQRRRIMEQQQYLVRELGAHPINELLKQAAKRHPATHRLSPHRF